MSILEAFLIAVSLCADCFAVSLCSGTGLAGSGTKGGTKPGAAIARIAIAFAIIQTALMFAGWALGAAIYGQDAQTFEDLYKRADEALYKSKRNGKNQLHFYDELNGQNDEEKK